MTGEPCSIPADLVAYADQRVAHGGHFLDVMVKGEIATEGTGPDDALAVLSLGSAIDRVMTSKTAMADALALAIRRLAALQH